MALAVTGIYALARFSRSVSDSIPVMQDPGKDLPSMGTLRRTLLRDDNDVVVPLAKDNLVVRDYSFGEIDMRTGPPDPNCFFDLFRVVLYDRSTGHQWDTEYHVGSGRGIEEYLKKNGW